MGQPERGAEKNSCLPKALLGCGCIGALFMLLGCLAVGGLLWFGYSKMNEFAGPYIEKGYTHQTGQTIRETETLPGPTFYTAQEVTIAEGAAGGVALFCQMAHVDGTIEGDLDFFGQILQLKSNSHVKGNLTVEGGQEVRIRGIVDGNVEMMGQILVVEETGLIRGKIVSKAIQEIDIRGQLLGEVEGNYQELHRSESSTKPRRIELPPAEEQETEVEETEVEETETGESDATEPSAADSDS